MAIKVRTKAITITKQEDTVLILTFLTLWPWIWKETYGLPLVATYRVSLIETSSAILPATCVQHWMSYSTWAWLPSVWVKIRRCLYKERRDQALHIWHRAQKQLDICTHLFFYWNCKKIINVGRSCNEHTAVKFTHVPAARERYRLLLLLVQYTANHKQLHVHFMPKTTAMHLWVPQVVSRSGRTLVFDRWVFPVLCSTYSWRVTTYVGKPSAIGQPTKPTQPFILLESINE